MAKSREDRVRHALREVINRQLPNDPDEDEATADERFEVAFQRAESYLER